MMELHNAPADVVEQIYKLASINLSPNVPGQVALGVMLKPPVVGDESFQLWDEERTAVLESLGRRARKITSALNGLEGVSCVAAGSLYAFPKITLPDRAIEEAVRRGLTPDVMYCLMLLESTGIATTPGSGFGQKEGSWHFRTTILVKEAELDYFVSEITRFHAEFMREYGGNGGFTSKL